MRDAGCRIPSGHELVKPRQSKRPFVPLKSSAAITKNGMMFAAIDASALGHQVSIVPIVRTRLETHLIAAIHCPQEVMNS